MTFLQLQDMALAIFPAGDKPTPVTYIVKLPKDAYRRLQEDLRTLTTIDAIIPGGEIFYQNWTVFTKVSYNGFLFHLVLSEWEFSISKL